MLGKFQVAVDICLILLSLGFLTDATNLVCYYNNVAFSYGDEVAMGPGLINSSLCTHFVYGYAKVNSTTFQVTSSDFTNDITNGGYTTFTGLRSANSKAKFLLALGSKHDSSDGSAVFSNLISNPTRIQTMVNSTLAFLQQYNFDGLSLDWIFPNTTNDFNGYSQLLIALKTAFQPQGYILSSSVSAIQPTIDGYNVTVINNYVDLVFLIAFGYYDPYTQPYYARHHAPLYTPTNDSTMANLNANFSVNYWIAKGLSPWLINLGIPFYGHTWQLDSTEVKSPFSPPASANQPSSLKYYSYYSYGTSMFIDVCRTAAAKGIVPTNEPNNYTGPWLVDEFLGEYYWCAYDDTRMAALKANYVLKNNLGGAMLWDISQDDGKNNCASGKFPLTNAVSAVLNSSFYLATTSTTTTTTSTTPTTMTTTSTTPTTSSTIVTFSSTNSSINPSTTTTKIAPTTLTALQPTTTTPNKCPTQNAVFPDATSCRKFNICLNGTVYATECPSGQYFNPITLRCDDDANNIKCPVKQHSKKSESLSYNAIKYDWKVNF